MQESRYHLLGLEVYASTWTSPRSTVDVDPYSLWSSPYSLSSSCQSLNSACRKQRVALKLLFCKFPAEHVCRDSILLLPPFCLWTPPLWRFWDIYYHGSPYPYSLPLDPLPSPLPSTHLSCLLHYLSPIGIKCKLIGLLSGKAFGTIKYT